MFYPPACRPYGLEAEQQTGLQVGETGSWGMIF